MNTMSTEPRVTFTAALRSQNWAQASRRTVTAHTVVTALTLLPLAATHEISSSVMLTPTCHACPGDHPVGAGMSNTHKHATSGGCSGANDPSLRVMYTPKGTPVLVMDTGVESTQTTGVTCTQSRPNRGNRKRARDRHQKNRKLHRRASDARCGIAGVGFALLALTCLLYKGFKAVVDNPVIAAERDRQIGTR